MKESLYSQWQPIFRETFNSEQDTRRNGGVPSNVVFSNWVASFNGTSSKINYWNRNNFFWGTNDSPLTFKARIKTTQADFQILCKDTSTIVWDYWLYTDATWHPSLILRDWTKYLAVVTTTATVLDWNWHTIVATYNWSKTSAWIRLYIDWVLVTSTTDLSSLPYTWMKNTWSSLYIWKRELFSQRFTKWEIDVVEQYNYAWTASQVANDYNNSTYKDIRNWLVLDIDSRQGVIEDKMGNTIPDNVWWSIKKIWGLYSEYQTWVNSYLRTWNITHSTAWLTVCWWFKVIKATNDANWIWFINKRLAGLTNENWQITYYKWKLNFNVWYWTVFNVNNYVSSDILYTLKKWKWIFICWTIWWIGTQAKLYENAVLIWTPIWTLPSNIYMSNIPVVVGCRQWEIWTLYDWTFTWYSNMIREYNRELSANEVSQLYTSQKPYFL